MKHKVKQMIGINGIMFKCIVCKDDDKDGEKCTKLEINHFGQSVIFNWEQIQALRSFLQFLPRIIRE
jgi:hypothetical protein